MPTSVQSPPIPTSETSIDQAAIADKVRDSYDASRPLNIVAGRTALNYGRVLSPADELDLTPLNRIVDYTPRDMTIVVEAGVRMADLAATLAAERQQLPIDVPRSAEATLGGVVATNWNGPRRLGYGTIRDYVIGINAVDGRGVAFKGGGRVVKNVAGYDFCKLLCGSLGTLGVITQLALKVKPLAETSATVVTACADVATARILLDRLADLPATPIAIDYVLGPGWRVPTETRNQQSEIRNSTPHIVVRVEGTEQETNWLADQIQTEFQLAGGMSVARLESADAKNLFQQQVEFADQGTSDSSDNSPLALKISVPPSRVTDFVTMLQKLDPNCSIQVNAANGILIARLAKFSHSDLTPMLVAKLRPAASAIGGSIVVLSTNLDGLTPHLIWGGRTNSTILLEQIKRNFDPKNILNPGRFVY